MKRVWKVIGIIAIIVAVLLAAFLYWTTWTGSSKEIETVANQFKPDPSWQQVTNQVIPPKTTCLDEECPSVHRRWKTNANLTKEEFRRVLEDSGWNFNIEDDCQPSSNVSSSGGQSLCSVSGMKNGYSVRVVVEGDYENIANGHIVLFVNK